MQTVKSTQQKTKQTYLSDYTDFHLVKMKEIEPTKHALLHTDIVHFTYACTRLLQTGTIV